MPGLELELCFWLSRAVMVNCMPLVTSKNVLERARCLLFEVAGVALPFAATATEHGRIWS